MLHLKWCLFSFASLYNQPGQTGSQSFGQQGVYNNMSITVSMAGGSGAAGSLPPIGPPVAIGNNSLGNVGSMCNDQVSGSGYKQDLVWWLFSIKLGQKRCFY